VGQVIGEAEREDPQRRRQQPSSIAATALPATEPIVIDIEQHPALGYEGHTTATAARATRQIAAVRANHSTAAAGAALQQQQEQEDLRRGEGKPRYGRARGTTATATRGSRSYGSSGGKAQCDSSRALHSGSKGSYDKDSYWHDRASAQAQESDPQKGSNNRGHSNTHKSSAASSYNDARKEHKRGATSSYYDAKKEHTSSHGKSRSDYGDSKNNYDHSWRSSWGSDTWASSLQQERWQARLVNLLAFASSAAQGTWQTLSELLGTNREACTTAHKGLYIKI